MSTECEVCGNTVDAEMQVCPFCNSKLTFHKQATNPDEHRIINLERGMPLVKQALERLRNELYISKKQGVRVVTLIHGYGSTGKGGSIKREVRDQLNYLKHQKTISEVIAGEDFSKRSGPGKQLLRRFSFLANHRDLNRSNPGITLVIF